VIGKEEKKWGKLKGGKNLEGQKSETGRGGGKGVPSVVARKRKGEHRGEIRAK